MTETPLLIAGLGNPGEKYARHRHNVGFMTVDAIAERHRFADWRSRYSGLVAEGTLSGRKTLLLKPMTYMNDSGQAVGAAARYLKLDPSGVVVIHDELDLAPGKLRAKAGGGDAGHNGLRSITATLGPDYRRVRIGIGHPGAPELVHGYVLRDFPKSDQAWLAPLIEAMAEAAPYLAKDDDAGFMNKVSVILKPPVKKPMPEQRAKKDDDGI
jgi:PTH1 family peptidyl-tRNA hydrolase